MLGRDRTSSNDEEWTSSWLWRTPAGSLRCEVVLLVRSIGGYAEDFFIYASFETFANEHRIHPRMEGGFVCCERTLAGGWGVGGCGEFEERTVRKI